MNNRLCLVITILLVSACASKPKETLDISNLKEGGLQDIAPATSTPPVTAPLPKGKGVIQALAGDVKVKSGTTGKVQPALANQQIDTNDTVITSPGAQAKIVMADKNELAVSPDSQVAIQQYDSEPSGKKQVLLNLIRGKVRATVKEKYEGKTNYFQIRTRGVVAGVRGTDFLASYKDGEDLSQIVTFDGSVEFGLPGENNTITNAVKVPAGEMSMASADSPPSTPIQLPKDQLEKLNKESKVDLPSTPPVQEKSSPSTSSAEVSLKWLQNGNLRFLKRRLRSDGQGKADIARVSKGQQPHATILSCSDSSAPPEIIFDQKLGEIFVVRTLGESVDRGVITSIEYAVTKLGTKLIVVMGHTSCSIAGTAQAKIKQLTQQSQLIQQAVAKGELVLQPAMYDDTTGEVRFE